MLEKGHYDFMIYTDGSVEEGRSNGGSGCVVKDRDGRTIETVKRPVGKVCWSCQAELKAIASALKEGWNEARKISNSQASLKVIETDNIKNPNMLLSEIASRIGEMKAKSNYIYLGT